MSGHRCPRLAICLLACLAISEAQTVAAEPLPIQSSRLDVVLDNSLDGFQTIRDRSTDRDFAQPDAKSLGLYRLTLGGGFGKISKLAAGHLDRDRSSRTRHAPSTQPPMPQT